jgi:two-component system, OmpR family, sensor histidine kinase VicK
LKLDILLLVIAGNGEKIEVLEGADNTKNVISQFMSNAKMGWDNCVDSTAPSVTIAQFKTQLLESKNRGARVRFVTEITNDNLSYCKELMDLIDELRHLDGIKGNFGVSKTEYVATAILQKAQAVTQVIYSNAKAIVEQHQYLFETLWNKSIPGEQKIREIEKGVRPDIIEVIKNSDRAHYLYLNIIKDSKEQILLIFPTSNAFIRQEKVGVIQSLIEAAEKHNVKVRILMPAHNVTEHSVQQLKMRKNQYHSGNIDIRYIEESSGTKATILVVDRKTSLVMELKDDSKTTFFEAIGLSTYSNSRPGVLSYVSIFESLWRQAELYEQVKEANMQLELANEQLKVHDKMQKEFINVAAHELRTPIQPIISTVGIIRSRKGNIKGQELDNSLDMIARSAERLKRLSSDILDITQIESHSLKLNKEQFNVIDVISNTVRQFNNQITKDNINIKLMFESTNNEDVIIVDADRQRITQVVSNLLNNAIKFTKKEGGVISIEVQKKDEEEDDIQKAVVITVRDTGQGIDPEIFPKLFTKFATKSFQGTGLGLFISINIVEAHGGKIWAENNINADGVKKGSVFYFTLPITNSAHNNNQA